MAGYRMVENDQISQKKKKTGMLYVGNRRDFSKGKHCWQVNGNK